MKYISMNKIELNICLENYKDDQSPRIQFRPPMFDVRGVVYNLICNHFITVITAASNDYYRRRLYNEDYTNL